ncbi:hypothetical protein SCP_0301700 [Sparassis crispa]|uniref:Uncharacterized protein n=1 Tax=Sparassis crispa TaxID=139825 RepID=A0A401GEA6_9APHY|nr:hypothetical protein SCP_0301700 [Sparassis crispa]GBE80455.1 hypothetical protein SCP_0301700 [Sparassis crispa]
MSRIVFFNDCNRKINEDHPHRWEAVTALVYQVQKHLVQSKSTRAAYLKILLDFYEARSEARDLLPMPTDEDVLHFFQNNFPHVHLYLSRNTTRRVVPRAVWRAQVGEAENEVFLPEACVNAVQVSDQCSGDVEAVDFHLESDAFVASAVLVLLHELLYVLIEHVFAQLPDPLLDFRIDSAHAEDWADGGLEYALLGFRIYGEWDAGALDVLRDMKGIVAEVEHPAKAVYSLDTPAGAIELRRFLDSFKTDTLHQMRLADSMEVTVDPPSGGLREHVQSALYTTSAIQRAIRENERKSRVLVPTVRFGIGGCTGSRRR